MSFENGGFAIPPELELSEREVKLLESIDKAQQVHGALVSYAEKTVHGKRFDLREFDPSVEHLLLNKALVPARPDITAVDEGAAIARGLAPNIDDLFSAIGDSYKSVKVQEHLKNGGSLIFADNHATYEGEPGITMGLTQQRVYKHGEDLASTVYSQHIVAGRLIGIFMLHKGVVETLLLPNANLLQTLPLTASGNVFSREDRDTRKAASKLFKLEQFKVLRKPGSITVVNFSGTQDENTGSEYIMGPVHPRTAELYAALGDSASRLLVIPCFIRSEAIDDLLIGRAGQEVVDFAFGEPIDINQDSDIYDIQQVIAELGTKTLESSHREDRRGMRVSVKGK